jgi:hypothetical protein
VIFSRTQTSASLAKGCHGTRSQPFSGMRANQRTGSVDGWPKAGMKKAGGQQLRKKHRDLSVTIAQVNPCRSFGAAHSSPRESGWAQTDALYLISIRTLARVNNLQRRLWLHVHGAIGAKNAGDSTSLRAPAEISQLIRKWDRVACSGAVPTSGPYGNARISYVRYRTHAKREVCLCTSHA